jgi:hypothetical protein
VGLVTGQLEGEIPVVEELCHFDRIKGDWRWSVRRLDDLPPKIADKFSASGIDLSTVVASFGSVPDQVL